MTKGRITREFILTQAFELASVNGLESLTIGGLAKHCGLSKSGLFAHFQSKENLQLALVEFTHHTFVSRVIDPARDLDEQRIEHKLRCLLENWLNWNHSFQGSCLFLDAWKDAQSGRCPLQAALKRTIAMWIDYLVIQIEKGIRNGEFNQALDPKQAAFELYGLYLSAHLFYSIHGKSESDRYFWTAVEQLLHRWQSTLESSD